MTGQDFDIPVSEGHFDIEDYTQYLIDYIRFLGPEINVIAICQPAPLALAATAFFAQEDKKSQPKSLILMGGPIDPNATPTEITNFANKVTLSNLERTVIQRVGFQYAGAGPLVLMKIKNLLTQTIQKLDKTQ